MLGILGGVVGWFVGGAAAGTLGNAADRLAGQVWEEVRARTAGLRDLPAGCDLARAIRVAQLSASLYVVRDWEEANRFMWANRPDAREPAFAEAAQRHLHDQLASGWQLALQADEGLTRELSQAIDAGLADPSGPPAVAMRLRTNAEQTAYTDLTAGLNGIEAPDSFHDRFMGRARDRGGWHAAFILFLREIFANNERARTALVVRDLSAILRGTQGLAQLAQQLATDVGSVREDTAAIRETQREQSATLADLKQMMAAEILYLPRIRAALPESFAALPDERLPEALKTFVARAETIEAELAKRTNFPAAVEAARQRAKALVEALRIEDAEAELAKARALLRESREQTAREEAHLLREQANLAKLRLAYNEAGDGYEEAARIVAFDSIQSWQLAIDACRTFVSQGSEFGDNAALLRAIHLCERLLSEPPAQKNPWVQAVTQNDLAIALSWLGERGDTATLQRAVDTFRSAHSTFRRLDLNQDAVGVLINASTALKSIGEHGNTEALRPAADMAEQGVSEVDRSASPLLWALAQLNLGAVLATLAERSDPSVLPGAAKANFAQLTVFHRRTHPLEWATAMNNLGHVFSVRARGADKHWIHRAGCAFRLALTVRKRERVPLLWAVTTYNLGLAKLNLAAKGDVAAAKEAAALFCAALEERTRERTPFEWALTQKGLAGALLLRAEHGEPDLARRALASLRNAQWFFTLERDAKLWASLENNAGVALQLMANRTDAKLLTAAANAYQRAAEESARIGDPEGAAIAQGNLNEVQDLLRDLKP
jgi:hypothetical protein